MRHEPCGANSGCQHRCRMYLPASARPAGSSVAGLGTGTSSPSAETRLAALVFGGPSGAPPGRRGRSSARLDSAASRSKAARSQRLQAPLVGGAELGDGVDRDRRRVAPGRSGWRPASGGELVDHVDVVARTAVGGELAAVQQARRQRCRRGRACRSRSSRGRRSARSCAPPRTCRGNGRTPSSSAGGGRPRRRCGDRTRRPPGRCPRDP